MEEICHLSIHDDFTTLMSFTNSPHCRQLQKADGEYKLFYQNAAIENTLVKVIG